MGVGDQVFVIGAPYGLTYTLSVGYISGRQTPGAKVSGLTQIELFQTDASINTGNSGGPMFNMNGEVVGIVSYILSKSGGFEGLGFAVTSNIARQLLLEQATGWTGMQGVFIFGEHAAMLNVPQPNAILVESVAEGGLAGQLGVKGGTVKSTVDGENLILGGDVILSVNGIRISDGDASLKSIRESLVGTGPGTTLRAEVLRAGEIVELSVVVR
jgi:S1-C subfamily serine protease